MHSGGIARDTYHQQHADDSIAWARQCLEIFPDSARMLDMFPMRSIFTEQGKQKDELD